MWQTAYGTTPVGCKGGVGTLMVLWFYGLMYLWFIVLWLYGFVVLCFYGFLVLWFYILLLLVYGFMDSNITKLPFHVFYGVP